MQVLVKSLVVVGVAVVSLSGCKFRNSAGSSSDQKDLGGIAGEKRDAFVCKGTDASAEKTKFYETLFDEKNAAEGSIVAQRGYLTNLAPVLNAIPVGLLQWYFTRGGKVYLTENVNDAATCAVADKGKTIPFFDLDETLAGCLSTHASTSSLPNIYLRITAHDGDGQIEELSNLVQAFALLTSFFVGDISLVTYDAAGKMAIEINPRKNEIYAEKVDLGFFLLEDLQNSKLSSKTATELKKFIAAEMIFSSNDRNEQYRLYKDAINTTTGQQYVNYAFSQVLESAWCNNESRKILTDTETTDFKQTATRWSKGGLGNKVENTFADVSTPSVSGGSASLALTNDGTQGRVVFPVLRAIIVAPFAVARFFVEEKPVLTWIQQNQPVRKIATGTVRVAATAVETGGQVLGFAGRTAVSVVALPFRLFRR